MCKLGGGANRCDAHWGESQKAADLARRRAKYAAKKGGTVRAYTKKDAQAVVAEAKKVSRFDAEDFKVKAINTDNPVIQTVAGAPSKMKLKETGETSVNPELGLHAAHLAGSTVSKGYYASETIEGAVNWDNLDKDSYRAFGFTDIGETRGIDKTTFGQLKDMSKLEFKKMTKDNVLALRLFTSNAYSWINYSLYNRDEGKQLNSPAVEGQDVSMNDDYLEYEDRTVAKLQEVVKQMDDGMSKTSGQQRIVYRGLKRKFVTEGNESLEAAVKRKFALGQEMVFDGYQSTSYSPVTAVDYGNASSDNGDYAGVVFEIRTSSGVNVISESHYDSEKEVLLPRNSRYMVVGVHNDVTYSARDSTMPHIKGSRTYPGVHVIQLVEITENGEVASAENRPAAPPALTKAQTTEYTH